MAYIIFSFFHSLSSLHFDPFADVDDDDIIISMNTKKRELNQRKTDNNISPNA
jgi:hypothetical protein